jgi:hypothetical protein
VIEPVQGRCRDVGAQIGWTPDRLRRLSGSGGASESPVVLVVAIEDLAALVLGESARCRRSIAAGLARPRVAQHEHQEPGRGISRGTRLELGAVPAAEWYRDGGFWRAFLARYLPVITVANLLWEVAQLPLYSIWAEEPPGFVLYAVVHCTAGDALIAGGALLIAMCLAAPRGFPTRGFVRVALLATLFGLAYTVFSEWLNTAVRASWAYAPAMPIVPFLGVGLTPFLQWLVLPPLALFLAFRPRVAR